VAWPRWYQRGLSQANAPWIESMWKWTVVRTLGMEGPRLQQRPGVSSDDVARNTASTWQSCWHSRSWHIFGGVEHWTGCRISTFQAVGTMKKVRTRSLPRVDS